MYRSKHQKGYTTSHEVKTTRFRTWKSGKKWLYGATVLTLTASTLLPIGNLAFLPKIENAQAITTPANGALTAGQTADTGDHTYDSSAINTNNNWSIGGTSAWVSNWINFTTMNTSTWSTGYAYFTGASSMSFSSGFTLSGNFKAQKTTILLQDTGPFGSGDGIGFFLTPVSKTNFQANFNNAGTPPIAADPGWGNPYRNPKGPGLAIAGLSNSIFAGRDLYNDTTGYGSGTTLGPLDALQGTIGPSNNISIRTTDSTGALNRTGYSTVASPGNPLGGLLGVGNDHVADKMSLTWTPTATVNAQGQITGNLTLVDQPLDDSGNAVGSSVSTIYNNITVNSSMNIGAFGSTGGNQGALSLNVASMTFNGQKGQEPVAVNYINSFTKQEIPSRVSSTITANISDIVGVGATAHTPSTLNTVGNTYVFTPPATPVGYTLASYPSNITVQSYDASVSSNPNVLNVNYTPSQQTVLFNWAKASGTTLANLPNQIAYGATGITDASVVTDNPFSNTTLLSSYATALSNAVPAGYNITKISNGTTTVSGTTTTQTLAAFTAANPTVSATSANNNYTVTLTANPANIAGSFTFVDGTPGFTNTAGIAGPTGNLTLNGTGTTATVTANVGDVITIARGTSLSTTAGANVLTSSVTINSTTNTSPLTFTAPSGYYIVGYSYAGQLPQAFTTFNSGGATFTATSQSNNTIQFYLAPYSGAHYKSDGTLDLTASTSTYTDSIWKMSNAAGTTSTNGVVATNAAQPKVLLETTTATGTTTLGVTSGSNTYKMYTGTGLTTTAPTGNTVNAPTQFIASQGQAYSSMQGVSGTNKFPTTNAILAIPGYKIVSVRHSNNTGDISQTTGITTSGMTATTNFSSMEAALAGNNAYYNFPPNANNFTTNTTTNAAIDQFVVLYQPIPATVNVNNLTYTVGNMPSTNPSISALLTAALQSSSTNSDGSAAAATNMTISNLTNVGTGANLQASQLSSQPAGLYQVTYQYTDPINGTQTTALAYVNLINGMTTNVPLIGSASLTNTLNLGLNGSLTPISESVTNISYTDYEGNSKTVDITANDIELDNQGNVTIAQGKLHQGIYTISVTYSYASGGTATVSDTINVAEPFSLPFTGGEGIAGVVSLAALTGMGGVFLRKRKKSEEETLLKVDNSVALRKTERNKSKTFQQNRRTRPYQKLFHTKNRAHLAQLQRKGKSC